MNHIQKSEQPYFERTLQERQHTYDINDPLSDYHGFPEFQAMLANEPDILEQEVHDFTEWYGLEFTSDKLALHGTVKALKAHSA
jgi:hypothetical protein